MRDKQIVAAIGRATRDCDENDNRSFPTALVKSALRAAQ